MALIDPKRVNEMFLDCLFKTEELKDGKPEGEFIAVEGVMARIGFNPDRVKKYESEIYEALKNLPAQFQESTGGGWSFLMACNDRNNEQWTGLHQTMDQLFCLGLAIKKVSFPLPRELWDALPGAVPYVVVLN